MSIVQKPQEIRSTSCLSSVKSRKNCLLNGGRKGRPSTGAGRVYTPLTYAYSSSAISRLLT